MKLSSLGFHLLGAFIVIIFMNLVSLLVISLFKLCFFLTQSWQAICFQKFVYFLQVVRFFGTELFFVFSYEIPHVCFLPGFLSVVGF